MHEKSHKIIDSSQFCHFNNTSVFENSLAKIGMQLPGIVKLMHSLLEINGGCTLRQPVYFRYFLKTKQNKTKKTVQQYLIDENIISFQFLEMVH